MDGLTGIPEVYATRPLERANLTCLTCVFRLELESKTVRYLVDKCQCPILLQVYIYTYFICNSSTPVDTFKPQCSRPSSNINLNGLITVNRYLFKCSSLSFSFFRVLVVFSDFSICSLKQQYVNETNAMCTPIPYLVRQSDVCRFTHCTHRIILRRYVILKRQKSFIYVTETAAFPTNLSIFPFFCGGRGRLSGGLVGRGFIPQSSREGEQTNLIGPGEQINLMRPAEP